MREQRETNDALTKGLKELERKLDKKKEAHSKDAWDEEAKDLDQDVSAYIIETSIEFSQIHGKEDHGRKVGTTNF